MNLQDVQNIFCKTVAILFRPQGEWIIKVQQLSQNQTLIWKFHLQMANNFPGLNVNL